MVDSAGRSGALRRRCALRSRATCSAAFTVHALRIGKAGSGDQCRRSDRNQKAISHSKFSSRVLHCPPDNGVRWSMFPAICGSIDFVLCKLVLFDFV
jgi:hypothetical protein